MHAKRRQFASDNYAGICPEAWAALAEANREHAPSYGDDEWTLRARQLIRDAFEADCEVFFVFNGTAANSLALSALCRRHHLILAHELSHVATDECGAPEFFTGGARIVPLPGRDGKLDAATVEQAVRARGDVHYGKVRALTLTQATELGTVYSPEELRSLTDTAHALGLQVHLDGARLGNAVASLGVAPREMTVDAGVDVLSFGLAKTGGGIGEAVVFFNRALAEEFDYRCKQAGQLGSKMRYLAAPCVGMLREDAWLRHASHANRMAALLHDAIRAIPEARIAFPRQANSVFMELTRAQFDRLHELGWHFYELGPPGVSRFMCSWDTTEEDVCDFAGDLRQVLQSAGEGFGSESPNLLETYPG